MKKILIFGIDSFTGRYLSNFFTNFGYIVNGTTLEQENRCDITNRNDVLQILEKYDSDFIINLSAISFVAHPIKEDFYKINTIGALNILDSLIKLNRKPKKIILVSTAAVYGNLDKELLDESLCPQPANHYGASKLAMENLAKNYFDKLNIIITRPFNYTGIGQNSSFLIAKIIKHYKEGKKTIELGNLDVSREFNDIEYVCKVYKELLESNSKSEVVNIATNRAVKLLDIIDIMNEISGYNIKVKVNPKFIRKNEINKLTGSTEKLFKLIKKVEPKTIDSILREIYEA